MLEYDGFSILSFLLLKSSPQHLSVHAYNEIQQFVSCMKSPGTHVQIYLCTPTHMHTLHMYTYILHIPCFAITTQNILRGHSHNLTAWQRHVYKINTCTTPHTHTFALTATHVSHTYYLHIELMNDLFVHTLLDWRLWIYTGMVCVCVCMWCGCLRLCACRL